MSNPAAAERVLHDLFRDLAADRSEWESNHQSRLQKVKWALHHMGWLTSEERDTVRWPGYRDQVQG